MLVTQKTFMTQYCLSLYGPLVYLAHLHRQRPVDWMSWKWKAAKTKNKGKKMLSSILFIIIISMGGGPVMAASTLSLWLHQTANFYYYESMCNKPAIVDRPAGLSLCWSQLIWIYILSRLRCRWCQTIKQRQRQVTDGLSHIVALPCNVDDNHLTSNKLF